MKDWTRTLSIVAIALSVVAITGVSHNKTTAPETKVESAMQHVRETGVLRCGYFIEPPYTEIDPKTGKLGGIVPDMMAELGKYASIKVEFTTEVIIGTMLEDLNMGKYDAICSSLGYNPVRSKNALFVAPFVYAPLYTVVRTDETRVQPDLSNLEASGVTINTLDGEVGTLTAKARFPNAKYTSAPQMTDLSTIIQDIVDKKADLAFVSPQVFYNYNDHNPGKLKILSLDYPLATYPIGFAVKAGDRDLADFLSDSTKFLNGIGVLDQIYDKYDPKHQLFLRPAKIYQTGGPAAEK